MKYAKSIISISTASLLFLGLLFGSVEPSLIQAQAISTVSDSVNVSLTVDSQISITSPSDVTMAPNIDVSSNSSIGTAVWNVKTNDGDGYTLSIKNASTSPALKRSVQSQGNFADYTPGTPGTPDLWSVGSGAYEFGHSAFGTDVPTATWGTGANCGSAGTPTATLKYREVSTSNVQIATRTSTTTTSGIDSTVCFAAAQNGVFAAAGTYTAVVTATATVI